MISNSQSWSRDVFSKKAVQFLKISHPTLHIPAWHHPIPPTFLELFRSHMPKTVVLGCCSKFFLLVLTLSIFLFLLLFLLMYAATTQFLHRPPPWWCPRSMLRTSPGVCFPLLMLSLYSTAVLLLLLLLLIIVLPDHPPWLQVYLFISFVAPVHKHSCHHTSCLCVRVFVRMYPSNTHTHRTA